MPISMDSQAPSPPLHLQPFPIFLAWMDLIICLICIFTNGSIIWITFFSKKIRSNRCCLLIAILAALHIGAKSGSIVPTIIAWTVVTVPQLTCICLHTVGILSGPTAPCMILAIAIDRLIGATLPMGYKSMKTTPYIVCIVCTSLLVSIYDLFAIWQFSLKSENAATPVSCTAFYVVTEQSGLVTWLNGMITTIVSVFAYFAIWVIFQWHKRKRPDCAFVRSTKTIFRSLMVMMAVNTFGWVLGFSFVGITHTIIPNITPLDQIISEHIEIIILDLASSLDALILYKTSSMYRDAYKREFALIREKLSRTLSNASQMVAPTTGPLGQIGGGNGIFIASGTQPLSNTTNSRSNGPMVGVAANGWR